MKINSVERHEYNHTAVLSKADIENLLKEKIRAELDLPVGGPAKALEWYFEWGDTSIDSGLRKEPQIIVRVIHNLAAESAVAERPTE